MPQSCTRDDDGLYAVRHNPALYFADAAPDCQRWDLPMGTPVAGELHDALAGDGDIGDLALLVPDLCDDSHDCGSRTADDWLAAWLPQLVSSRPYSAGTTAIFITWDEGERAGDPYGACVPPDADSCHIGLLVIAPSVPPGIRVDLPSTHLDLLNTTALMLGVTLPGQPTPSEPDLRIAFHL
jgi:hypothetical protein